MLKRAFDNCRDEVRLHARRMRYGSPKSKVFCIGFHKTGTSSIGHALNLLGYRVAGMFDIATFTDGNDTLKRAIQLARSYDSVQDNPWPLFYCELDAAYPGSKFILTVREPQSWYGSVVRHFGENETPMRRWIYGVGAPAGHRDIYVDRFNTHYDQVREHFRSRPDDLLEINFKAGDGWDAIGRFLDTKTPKGAFPKLNVQTK